MAGLNNLGSEIIVKMEYDVNDSKNLVFPTNNLIDTLEYQDRNNE